MHLYVMAAVLTIAGGGFFLYKAYIVGFPLSYKTETTAWKVEARVTFTAAGKPVKVSLLIPDHQVKGFAILNETFISSGFGIVTTMEKDNRQATWSIRRAAGKQTLYYQSTIELAARSVTTGDSTPPKPKDTTLEGTSLQAAKSLMKEVKKRSADIPSMVAELITQLNRDDPDDNVKLLIGPKPNRKKRMIAASRVLRFSGVPARVVSGIRLRGTTPDFYKNIDLIHWLEVYDGKAWASFSPATGKSPVPEHWFRWCVGAGHPANIEGGDNLRVTFSARPLVEKALSSAVNRAEVSHPSLLKFSLFSLPVSTQAVYRVLLLVPVGAFLLVLLRNVVGIKTFGTFMPVLIALSFRETGLIRGIVIFVVLVALGLGVRFWLEQLKLLVVPRLAAVLIVVVGLMTMLSVMTKALGGHTGLSVALFPMVILTMTIERMSIVVEERGLWEALTSGMGSIICASLAYMVMNIKEVEHLVFVFPELLLVLLAATLMVGRYTGYRLMDLYRFKALAGS
ncbi:MAG: UUP1 family membrane protein [Desulfomonilaceae bacterium]|nr:UUP1 family membrane protein [Desulfomonilaceae bacterium]